MGLTLTIESPFGLEGKIPNEKSAETQNSRAVFIFWGKKSSEILVIGMPISRLILAD